MARLGPTCLCLNLRMAARDVTSIYDDAMRPLGLRITQFALLSGIDRMGPVTSTRLSDALALDKTTMPRSLAHLHKAALIEYAPGQDKREKLVSLTPKGRRLLEKARKPWAETQARLAEALGDNGLERVLGQLRRVRAVVRKGGMR